MPNPAFIVEGQMEQRIIGKICPGKPIRRIGCNGDHVSINRMCDFIETQVRTLGNRNYPIFVVFDREKRNESPDQIKAEVLSDLAARGLGDQDIRVFVADREVEDWYLLDAEGICNHYGLNAPPGQLNGKGGMDRLLSPIGGYHETTTGVDIFFIVSKQKIGSSCPMFADLIAAAIEVECFQFTNDNLL